jgi:DNA-binding MarR family transcriptional regulator
MDHQKLHQRLWDDSRRGGRIEIHQRKLSEDLGVTQATMCAAIQVLVEQGALKKIASRKTNIGVYVVREPERG